MIPRDMKRIINRKRYDTSTATLIAGDDWWDGSNRERHGTNRFLFRTPKGAYFVQRLTMWQGDHDALIPVSLEEAVRLYEEELLEHVLSYEEAFPEIEVEEA